MTDNHESPRAQQPSSRLDIRGPVMIACASMLVAQLVPTTVAMMLTTRAVQHPDAPEFFGWGTAVVGVLITGFIFVGARLTNWLRPSGFLAAGLGILLVTGLASLLPARFAPAAVLVSAQDLGAALVTVVSLLIVAQLAVRERRGRLLGYWVAMVPLGMTIGIASVAPIPSWRPMVCGVLVLALVVLLACLAAPPDEPARTSEKFDLPGAALWIIAVAGVLWLLKGEASEQAAITGGAAGFIAIAALVYWIRRTGSSAIVPGPLISRRPMIGALAGTFALKLILAVSAVSSAATTWVSSHDPAHPEQAYGLLVLALSVPAALAAVATGVLWDRELRWAVPVCGAVLMATGYILPRITQDPTAIIPSMTTSASGNVFNSAASIWDAASGLALCGAGASVLGVWLLCVGFAGLPRPLVAVTAGLLVTASELGQTTGVFLGHPAAAEHLATTLRTAAVPIAFAVLALAALVIVPTITRRWGKEVDAQNADNRQESDTAPE
ncbi:MULTISPECIES: hypothetical protein [unclassified Mycolicibacterium]|uniref:hypothetical protein n=1 Tax=unclassified Mycolicibacterium TaxID=2636767 RepID=UPI0012DE965C|nr:MULTISPECIES: hypothetical protein [unclassified Mycolicibacterium]MUL82968.1 MFS transporter [Mycolicibacterium sp. CBMA 329]MUL89303.1 MFS transporter [Mycolicibacterium sp. CBMA 331]MUM02770.1 MFS transporter [Mycolicibacterium sp. CBMA 334]MUM28908.1 MFS transporter [Mycolicibacterium sp. CBMA 295]MUM38819.1 MFS transporter [Mycolicibacterium sp. CBMA 247]